MPLKNYTSTVSASKSIGFIEMKLAKHGAKQILKFYDGEKVSGICFIVMVNGNDMPFKLPARINECERVLRSNLGRRTRPSTYQKIAEQAERTAWKILSDWIEAQMAMIELAQVELIEVFLPYVYDYNKGQTYFQVLKAGGFKLLPSARHVDGD